ncbi:MAG: hypothetical protein KBF96_04465 [Ignavibacteria bacterium]|jgi:hypothetical protein|nr:hypothetical protein [Ignavibacteria bacterium]
MENGKVVYEYNMMMIERYTGETKDALSEGKHLIEVVTNVLTPKPLSEATVTINVDGKEQAVIKVGRTVPAAFTASESFNVGIDLGSPVSARYFEKAPFKFDGKINTVKIDLI